MGYDTITQAAIDFIVRGDGTKRLDLQAAIEAKHPGAIARAHARHQKARQERVFKGKVPDWVKRLVNKHGDGRVRSVTIRQSRYKPFSSGHCHWNGEITVTLSAERAPNGTVEQRAVMCHEIAHALEYGDHDDRFYATWRRLLVAEGIFRQSVASGRFRRTLRKAPVWAPKNNPRKSSKRG